MVAVAGAGPGRLSVAAGAPGESLRLAGEITAITRPVWREALGMLTPSGPVVRLQLSAVTFVDVAGMTELVMTAQGPLAGRRIVLLQPPPQVPRLLEMFWPTMTGIEVEG